MCNINLLLCLVVVAGVLANPEDGRDLNLKSIFRTPKDFSKVNFDHFELLERNNFDEKSNARTSDKTMNIEEPKTEEKTPKSHANAQVMLRIGGEDIHDCNHVILHRSPCAQEKRVILDNNRPLYTQSLPLLQTNDIRYPCLPPPTAYPYLPLPPCNYPGCYYNSGPLPNYLPHYQAQNSGSLTPAQFSTNYPETVTTIERPQGRENFLELPKREEVVICTESPKPQVILEKPNQYVNPTQGVEIIQLPKDQCPEGEEHYFIPEPQPAQPTAASYASIPTVQSTPECVTTNSIGTTTVQPNPTSPKLTYVEVNLADAGKPCFDTPKDNIATLLDQALVPLSCQKCSQKRPLLLSYPVVATEKNPYATPEEQIIVNECPSCNHHGFCDSCNRERNPLVPYGQRFSKDIDSLFEIVDTSPELHVPSNLYNETPSESLIKVQPAFPPKRIVEVDYQTEWSIPNAYPQAEEVQIVNPCQETIERPTTTQEVVSCPQTVATIEPPCTTNTVTVEQPSIAVPTENNHQTEWSTENICEQPCHQEVVQTIPQWSETIESPCATQEIVQVSKPSHTITIQPVLKKVPIRITNYRTFFTKPYPQEEVVPVYNPSTITSCDQQAWQPCHETILTPQLPCSTNEVNVHQPFVYSSSCNTNSDSYLSLGYTSHGNEQPKVYVDGYKATTGCGYYSDPLRSIIYRQPTVVDTYNVPNPSVPVLEHTNYVRPQATLIQTYQAPSCTTPETEIIHPYQVTPVSHHAVSTNCAPEPTKVPEPHIYKIVARYDVIPRGDIKTLNVPDLVPTNQYLKVNVPHKASCHRECVPVDRIPIIRNEFYIHGWPFWKSVPVQREVPLAPCYQPSSCTTCAKYRGELNEITCQA